MKKYYFTIASTLFLFFGIISCSNEETKTQNQVASRPTVPILNGEVQIGTQIWMTKNLNVTRYRNGDPIPQITNQSQWNNTGIGAWCYYENNSANGIVYGKLYNGHAVNDPRGLSPEGYHIPSDAEWTILTNFLGGQTAGGKMKTTTRWDSPNSGATNSSGFTGLPGGIRTNPGSYGMGTIGIWWSMAVPGSYFAYTRALYYDNMNIGRFDYHIYNGMSVRCVKN